MAVPHLIGEPATIGPDDEDAHCTRLVLAVYTAVIASSRNDRGAFDAAVETYRTEKSDSTDVEARRAVAEIICRKP
jgi:hypothetical protein